MENWFELPNEQLLETLKEVWYLKSPKLIGKLIRRGRYYFFSDIRSHEFRKVEYPENPYNKEIEILFSPEEDSALNLNSYYEFYIGVRDIEKRVVRNRLLVLFASKKNYIELTPKPFIERRSKVYTGINIELADTIRKAIKTLTSDINREPETFIYELLQNADDYKDNTKKAVAVKFILTPNYLLLTHDGQPFNFQNVYALTGISQGDKRDNVETIGFKGIGFKSIFKDSNFSIIKSGGFEFKFDESCFPKEAKRPWQIIPVWVENYDEELLLNTDFNAAPVSIAIKPTSGNEKLREVDKSYKNILSRVFKDDRILIFLRWIDKVSITDTTDSDYLIELNKNKEKWFISTGLTDIEVEESIRNWLNKQISDEDITIPEKYENIQKTKITFAVERAGNKLAGTTNSKVYNYLPTEIDFGFKFLINGDFIPDGSRTELHNNEWNNYLGKITGIKFVEWLSVLGNHTWEYIGKTRKFDRDFLNLIPDFTDPKALSAGRNTFFLEKFKEGFKEAITGNKPVSFVPIRTGELEVLSNTFIDETGLSIVIASDFASLTDITLKPIHNDIGEGLERIKALINEYDVGKIFTPNNLKFCLQQEIFQAWLKTPENNSKVLKHFFNSTNSELKLFIETEEIILSESGELSRAEEIYSSIPAEIIFITNNVINSKLKALLERTKVELKTKKFNATEFLNSNKGKINSLLTSETNIVSFWNFIYDNWKELKENDEVKKALRSFYILCKPVKAGELTIKQVSATYLSREFAGEDEVESIIESLKLAGKFFIDPKFQTKRRPSISQWNEIFSGAKSGLFAIMNDLILQLKELEDSQHLKACHEIFNYWRGKNKDKAEKQLSQEQLASIRLSLKLKTEDSFQLANFCLIPQHFSGDKRLKEILPSISLRNQISSEYQPKESLVSDWKQFFVLIGCKDLNSEQLIFNSKLDFFLLNQAQTRENHFSVIMEMDYLFTANESKDVKLVFDFINKLSKLQLLSSTKDVWKTPNEIHFPSEYKPELDLQSDRELESNVFDFLSQEYFSHGISKAFLLLLGVKSNFSFKPNTTNGYNFYPVYLSNHKKYLPQLWDFITESDLRVKQFAASNILSVIKSHETIEISRGVFKKPRELYSSNLKKYIEDKALFSLQDFSKYSVSNSSLEVLIGINQELNISQCLTLLKKPNVLTQNEVSSLKIVDIIQRNQILVGDLIAIRLPNTNYNWMLGAELYTSTDAEIVSKHPNNLLNNDFSLVAGKLLVRKISTKDYEFRFTKEKDSNADEEIKRRLKERAEYLAFVIQNGLSAFENTASQIISKIETFSFVKCDALYASIKHGSLEWRKELSFLSSNSIIYFLDELSSKKSEIRKHLYNFISTFGKINERLFYRYLFDESVLDIIRELQKDYDIPKDWVEKLQGGFRKEVEDFIQAELENTEWNEYIPELKNILELSISHPKEKQKLYNLIAKLKLAMHKGIHFDKAEKDFNHLVNGTDKYFVHSARGSFAYIHPNEILRMKSDGYKMALDFGSKSQVKIYDTPEEILKLNTNHLLAYQYEKTMEDLFSFCESNKDAHKHLLIIDRDNSKEKSREIFNLLNPEDDYQ